MHDTKIPDGYTERADKYLSRNDWLELLAAHAPANRNPATARLLASGNCTFELDGVRYAGPCSGPAPERATHTTRMRVDAITDEKGKTSWTN
jgi:hypothetical protein